MKPFPLVISLGYGSYGNYSVIAAPQTIQAVSYVGIYFSTGAAIDREFVLSLGGEEVLATIGKDGKVILKTQSI